MNQACQQPNCRTSGHSNAIQQQWVNVKHWIVKADEGALKALFTSIVLSVLEKASNCVEGDYSPLRRGKNVIPGAEANLANHKPFKKFGGPRQWQRVFHGLLNDTNFLDKVGRLRQQYSGGGPAYVTN